MSGEPIELGVLWDGRTSVKPLCYLDPPRFDAFRHAVRDGGGRFDRDVKMQVCERGQTEAVRKALHAADFHVSDTDDLRAAMKVYHQEQRKRNAGAGGLATAMPRRIIAAGGTLYPYQQAGVAWLASRDRALYADQMGLGKTAVTLMALPPNASVVVVCPASIKGVWAEEIEKWRPEFTTTVLAGRGSFRWPEPQEIVVLNYAILPEAYQPKKNRAATADPKLGPVPLRVVLIADEAHKLKSAKTKQAKRFRALSRSVLNVNGRVYLLSGTPMLNRPGELWQVLRAANLEIEAFGSWPNFRRLFRAARGRFGQTVFREPSPEVPGLLKRVMLRRIRKDVMPELPDIMERDLIVEDIDDETMDLCDEAMAALKEAGVNISDKAHDVDLSDLREVMKRFSSARTKLAAAKIPALLELVESYEESGEPLVVFSSSRAPIDVLAKRNGWAVITGDTPKGRRPEIAGLFRDGRFKGVALTIHAGAMGLTLCGGQADASHVVFCGLDYTPAMNQQATYRLNRIGQKNAVQVTRLVADHELDRHVTALLVEKQHLIDSTIPVTGDPS